MTLKQKRESMRKYQKKQIQQIIELLEQAHEQFLMSLENKKRTESLHLLTDCQDGAIAIGNMIEESEGEGFVTVKIIEDYCEQLYVLHEMLIANVDEGVNESYRILDQLLMQISVSVINDIPTRLEAVFLPYKAAMWDSLESVWQTANEDPDCDAYVIPIPYYDRNPDGSFKEMHYEADLYPADIPITKYDEYDFGKRQPDMIFIHNPYDEHNYVTSVHPFFYSKNLKQFTDCLVYIPYFATSGGFGEGQKLCSAYIYADYIVVQSEKYIDFYDEQIPREKFLPFGSPKFDSVIHKCQNPPTPPEEWQEMMAGKKVYFYNTSLSGMLADTDAFLKKMRYVFDTFKGRGDVCLLWRPHPLMESTFQSMRPEYMEQFQALKDEFIQDRLGIYDTTPDIENTIALSDVYIGDAGSSVTSLFGVVGKPIFILDNYIHSLPDEDSWRGKVINPFWDMNGDYRYHVTPEGQLWYSENNDFHYEYYMTLDERYGGGYYYLRAIGIKDKIYVIPANAQHMLIVQDYKIIRKIEFQKSIVQAGAFRNCWYTEKYIFILPFNYPAMIRFDLQTEEIIYVNGIPDFHVCMVNGKKVMGAVTQYKNELVLASPNSNQAVFLDMDSLQMRVLEFQSKQSLGVLLLTPDKDSLWISPMLGITVLKWNPITGQIQEYSKVPKEFRCTSFPQNISTQERPFAFVCVVEKEDNRKVILSPMRGNIYVELDEASGEMKKWEPPMVISMQANKDYFQMDGIGGIYPIINNRKQEWNLLLNMSDRRIFAFNLLTNDYHEIGVTFDHEQLVAHVPGFWMESEWMQYCCHEDAFNSLQNLLDDRIITHTYEYQRALHSFEIINASVNGDCGKKILRFIKSK